jgi:ABC-type antimicrobial peptide transport system permease subunit
MIVPLAVKALRRHLMRTVLTMLGVIIGVSAVICTITPLDGAIAAGRADSAW